MSAQKISINTEWLSVCGGCHVGIVDLHEKILDVLGAAEIRHCPVLTDIKGYPEADVGIITGAIRNEHDRHAAEAMRKACKLVIGLGTCAVYGGLPGAGIVHSRDEIFDTVYLNNRTTKTDIIPSDGVSPLEKMVTPLDEAIHVDLYLPGCPPASSFIFDGLLALLENKQPRTSDESVCGRCRRRMTKTDVAAIKQTYEDIPDPDICFLSQGYICLGSVTLDRCLSPCTRMGVTCTGCAGPTLQVLTEPNRDIRTEVGERMARLTKIEKDTVIHAIERGAKTHYAYAMATKMIGGKPTFLINQWIAETERVGAEGGAA